jgi:hypothetical protein
MTSLVENIAVLEESRKALDEMLLSTPNDETLLGMRADLEVSLRNLKKLELMRALGMMSGAPQQKFDVLSESTTHEKDDHEQKYFEVDDDDDDSDVDTEDDSNGSSVNKNDRERDVEVGNDDEAEEEANERPSSVHSFAVCMEKEE